MRVLIIAQNFLPEMGAPSNRLYPIVRQLVAEGHEVFVATGMPNYPAGAVFPEYRGRRFMNEEMDGCTVLRTLHYTTPRNQSKWKQLRCYLSFIPAAFMSGLRAGRLDVIFVTSPPLFTVVPAIWLAKLRRSKLVFDIRDLWPDEIVACGAGREGSLPVRLVRAIERWIYRSADCVSCTTHAFIDTVVERGVPREKTVFTPNGADLELFRPLPRQNPIAAEYPFGDRFVVMYSGLLGIKHGLETVLDAADLLRAEKDIVFFIRGNGPRRNALIERAQEMKLENVIFGDERKLEEIPHLIARSDACVTGLLPDAYLEKIISVKIFEYMACEKPVVAALAGEGARVIEEADAGLVVPAGDAPAMAEAIRKLYRDPELRARMGRQGRRHVEENYSRGVTAARLEKTLRKLVGVPTQQEAMVRSSEQESLQAIGTTSAPSER